MVRKHPGTGRSEGTVKCRDNDDMNQVSISGVRGVIFDFDGTLMDSMPDWSRKMLWQLDEAGISYPSDIIRRITPLGDIGAAEYFRELGLKRSVPEIVEGMQAYAREAYRNRILPKPGVPEFLVFLAERGIRMCVLTASPRSLIAPCLARCRMDSFFSFTCSCDEVGMTKSDPEIYRRTSERLGIPMEECLFFDDNLLALSVASEAGLRTVGVWDSSSSSDWNAICRLTDWQVTDFRLIRTMDKFNER